MRTKFLIALLFLIGTACSSTKPELTQMERDQIKKELSPVVNNMVASWENGKVNEILKLVGNESDFISVDADGTINDYAKFKESVEGQFQAMSSMTLTKVKEEYRILQKDIVLYVWSGKIEGHMNDGSLLVINVNTVSFLMQKFNEEWKVIYKGAAALPEVMQKSDSAKK